LTIVGDSDLGQFPGVRAVGMAAPLTKLDAVKSRGTMA